MKQHLNNLVEWFYLNTEQIKQYPTKIIVTGKPLILPIFLCEWAKTQHKDIVYVNSKVII